MTANDNKSYLGCLNRLVDECYNTCHRSIGTKLIYWFTLIIYFYFYFYFFCLIEEIETNPEDPMFKDGHWVIITKHKSVFSKNYNKNWSKQIFAIDSVLKTNPCSYKIKDLNEETITRSFYEKYLFFSKLYMSYCPEPDNHIRDKAKVVLGLSNRATKKN